jgi:hypothetical protein
VLVFHCFFGYGVETGLLDSNPADPIGWQAPQAGPAARNGPEFGPETGEPVLWAAPEPVTVTRYQHAAAYVPASRPRAPAQLGAVTVGQRPRDK